MGEDLVRNLYDSSYRRLVGQLYAVCGDMAEAEDVVQEAFVRAVQHRRRFERTDNPEAWLRTVAVNLSRTRWRRRQLGRQLQSASTVATTDQIRHPADLSDDRLLLVSALRRLPAGQREAIALHYLADLPLHEVALAVGAPIGTIKARLSRGRAALATGLAEQEARSRGPRTEPARVGEETPHA
jgi:RNA polymerase sigma-70 factor (ECF subfamily)